MSPESLTIYLQDHHATASAAVDLFRRVAEGHSRPEVREQVARMADEVAADREALASLMAAVETSPSLLKDVPARLGEKAGRLKPNGSLVSRSPLADLLELEALTLSVHGSLLGLRTLRTLGDPRLDQAVLDRLIERAEGQGVRLDALRRSCADVLGA